MPNGSRRRLAALVAGGVGALALARRAVFRDARLVRTMAGPTLVYTTRDGDGTPLRVLRTGGVYQSATYLGERRMEPPFAYHRAFGQAFDLMPNARRLLVIGGGGFAFPKLVAVEHPYAHMDVVEVDPAVVEVARRWFFLGEAICAQRAGGGELNVIIDDGRRFMDRAIQGSYDVVVVDAFVGSEPVVSLVTAEAAASARRALGPEGVYLTNVVSCGGGADVSFLCSVMAALATAFDHVSVACVTDELRSSEDNYLVVASAAALDLPGAIAYDEDFLGPVLHDTSL